MEYKFSKSFFLKWCNLTRMFLQMFWVMLHLVIDIEYCSKEQNCVHHGEALPRSLRLWRLVAYLPRPSPRLHPNANLVIDILMFWQSICKWVSCCMEARIGIEIWLTDLLVFNDLRDIVANQNESSNSRISFLYLWSESKKEKREWDNDWQFSFPIQFLLFVLTIIRRNAACASDVTVSASSKMIILKGGLGYLVLSSSSSAVVSIFVLISPSLVKKDFLGAAPWPTDKVAKCLILSRTTEIPRSSEAFNSKTRRRHCEGCHNCRHSAKATEV